MIGLVEFPKSGGTWVGQVLATYLGVPLPQRPRLPVLMRSIWHGHWGPPTPAGLIVVRDPRDCYVSLFHHRVAMASSAEGKERDSETNARFTSHFPDSVGSGRGTSDDLNRYVELLLDDNRLAEPDWNTFHSRWVDFGLPPVAHYSALREAPLTAYGDLIVALFGTVDRQRLDHAVQRFDISVARDSNASFVRKGQASGGWRSEVKPELWEPFAEHFPGELLDALGLADPVE